MDKEKFLQFYTIFLIYIFNKRSLITHSFEKFSCAICIFFNSENLICRNMDISKCFGVSVTISMGERKTDVTTFSKTFQEKQKTFPCDLQDYFQIALLYIGFQTNAGSYKEDLFVIAILTFVILIAH